MAGAGYKLFNTGDVLTAAQVNTYLQEQTVMVFANASARTTALSGVLAEGMMSYLKDDNKVYKYDGSAWSEVGASTSGLTLIGSTTFTASSAADFDDIFTSTYDTYLVVGEDITASTSGSYVGLQFRYGTSTQNSTCYGVNFGYNVSNSSEFNGQSNTSAFVLCRVNSASDFASFHFFVNQVGNTSEKAKFRGQFQNVEGSMSGVIGGWVNTDRTYTGLRFLPHPAVGGGNPISGKITVYGLAK